jgi:hypothetical protein
MGSGRGPLGAEGHTVTPPSTARRRLGTVTADTQTGAQPDSNGAGTAWRYDGAASGWQRYVVAWDAEPGEWGSEGLSSVPQWTLSSGRWVLRAEVGLRG